MNGTLPAHIVAVHSLLTIYMILILLRWFGPRLSLQTDAGRLRWIALLTDPLIGQLRKLLPSMGPVDFGPIAALFVVWMVRALSIPVLYDMAMKAQNG